MKKFLLPHVILPAEFLTLLTSNVSVTTSAAPVFDIVKPNRALYSILEKSFHEFDDGRGLEKTMVALGWSNFRDRMASIYIYKSIHGHYPVKTDMELVEDIKNLENTYMNFGVHSNSRVFMLGFYIRMANLLTQRRENNKFLELKIPEETAAVLKLSQGRSEKIDWLILIIMHLSFGLGDKLLMNSLAEGKKIEELYPLLSADFRKTMFENLLAYGASIREQDIFIYDKI